MTLTPLPLKLMAVVDGRVELGVESATVSVPDMLMSEAVAVIGEPIKFNVLVAALLIRVPAELKIDIKFVVEIVIPFAIPAKEIPPAPVSTVARAGVTPFILPI